MSNWIQDVLAVSDLSDLGIDEKSSKIMNHVTAASGGATSGGSVNCVSAAGNHAGSNICNGDGTNNTASSARAGKTCYDKKRKITSTMKKNVRKKEKVLPPKKSKMKAMLLLSKMSNSDSDDDDDDDDEEDNSDTESELLDEEEEEEELLYDAT